MHKVGAEFAINTPEVVSIDLTGLTPRLAASTLEIAIPSIQIDMHAFDAVRNELILNGMTQWDVDEIFEGVIKAIRVKQLARLFAERMKGDR